MVACVQAARGIMVDLPPFTLTLLQRTFSKSFFVRLFCCCCFHFFVSVPGVHEKADKSTPNRKVYYHGCIRTMACVTFILSRVWGRNSANRRLDTTHRSTFRFIYPFWSPPHFSSLCSARLFLVWQFKFGTGVVLFLSQAGCYEEHCGL